MRASGSTTPDSVLKLCRTNSCCSGWSGLAVCARRMGAAMRMKARTKLRLCIGDSCEGLRGGRAGGPHLVFEMWVCRMFRSNTAVYTARHGEDLVRYQRPGDLYFVTFFCYRRLLYLGTAGSRGFERSLKVMCLSYN